MIVVVYSGIRQIEKEILMSEVTLFVRKASGLVRSWSVFDAFIYATFSITLRALGYKLPSTTWRFSISRFSLPSWNANAASFLIVVYNNIIKTYFDGMGSWWIVELMRWNMVEEVWVDGIEKYSHHQQSYKYKNVPLDTTTDKVKQTHPVKDLFCWNPIFTLLMAYIRKL